MLRRCLNNRPDAGCVLFFNITGCTKPTVFSFVAQLGDTPIDLTDNDWYPGVLYNNASNAYKDNQRYRVGVSSPTQLAITIEQCVGSVSAYLNYPAAAAFPTNSSNDVPQRSTTSILQFALGSSGRPVLPDSVYYVMVENETPELTKYWISSTTLGNSSTWPTITQPALNCQPGENSLTFSFNPKLTAFSSSVLYNVYYLEDAATNAAAMWTRCGVEQPGVKLYKSWKQSEVESITASNGMATFTVNETGISPPLNSTKLYRWSILVFYESQAYGFASYTPVQQHPLEPRKPSDGNKAAEDAGAIVLGVVLPITLILAGVALYLYIRNRKLRQELSVELPDVSATPSSAAARRRAQRGPDVQTDSFTRGGGDMYNSLLGEDEQAGGEDSSSRRKARAARKAGAAGNGSSDLPEDSDVAYRSDVI